MKEIHNKYYVRTPDLSVYEETIKKLSPDKPKSADKPFRVPVHAAPLKVPERFNLNFDLADQQLYYFPSTPRTGRMTSREFYRGFSCTGQKSNAIISNFLQQYLERKINKEMGPYSSKNNASLIKGKPIRSKKYRQKYRSLPQVVQPTDDRSTTLNTLRETLRWKQKFLAATTNRDKQESIHE